MTVTHGFELIKEEHIQEINAEARIYRHIKSGAELLSLCNDDENKVFGITFRTPPPAGPPRGFLLLPAPADGRAWEDAGRLGPAVVPVQIVHQSAEHDRVGHLTAEHPGFHLPAAQKAHELLRQQPFHLVDEAGQRTAVHAPPGPSGEPNAIKLMICDGGKGGSVWASGT